MEDLKILYIAQEIMPYVPQSEISDICRHLPQAMQERKMDVRLFMPRYGHINERRNQLHEVIRLSGQNITIDNTDHPLIIKVASIPSARLQVYFIDNEDLFKRKGISEDNEGNTFEDNDERMAFFSHGVLETLKKLRWTPNIIHCHGWMTSLVPFYVKKSCQGQPELKGCKIVTSVYNERLKEPFSDKFSEKVRFDGISEEDMQSVPKEDVTLGKLMAFAAANSDAVIMPQSGIDDATAKAIDEACGNVKRLDTKEETFDELKEFYSALLG